MRRVAIVGCGGSGKSVLAREISSRTGIPVVHLDTLFWREDWQPTTTHVCLYRVLRRRVRGLFGSTRPDLGLPDRLTLEFLRWIVSYRRTRRPKILQRLAELGPGTRVVILESSREVQRFGASLPAAESD